jgi:polyisoprenoid-binding protein YceI
LTLIRRAVTCWLGLTVAGWAAGAQSWPDADVVRGSLSFDGKSTLGDFTGSTGSVRGQMTGAGDLTLVRGWVEAPVNTLKTGNDRRDRDLLKTMEAEIFPTIRFELTGVTPEWQRGDSAGVLLRGNFVIHGVTRAETVPATVTRTPEGIQLRTTPVAMDLHDYGIDKLTRFLVFKMKRDIVVHIELLFHPAGKP